MNREPAKSYFEKDCFGPWSRVIAYIRNRARVRSKAKRAVNKRARRRAKREIE